MGLTSFPAWLNQVAKVRMDIVTGALHGVDMTLTGAKVTDVILDAVDITTGVSCTENPVITAAGKVQFPVSDAYSTKKVLILWAKN